MTEDDVEPWLTELFQRHSAAVLRYSRRRLESPEDAEDVVVEVFATAWRRRDVVPDPPLPWLYTVAANVIAHVIRSDVRRTRLHTRLASVSPIHGQHGHAHGPLTPDIADVLSDRATVAAALDDLSDSDAELLRLWAWEGLEPAEIAEILGCSPGTARTRMHRARTRLREALHHRGMTGAALTGESQVGNEPKRPREDDSGASPSSAAPGPENPDAAAKDSSDHDTPATEAGR